jgi:5-formyltetrahydrofolate cyclo-ligase
VNAADSASLRAEKKAIRAEVNAALERMSQADRDRATDRAFAQLEPTAAWRDARCVMIYAPMMVEPSVDRWWDDGARRLGGRTMCYPRIAGRDLEVRIVRAPGQLRPAAFGLREPNPEQTQVIEVEQLDLVVVPGLAFTTQGDRLGRGAGYYDRFLATLPRRVSTVALAFACQVRDRLPVEPHDQRVGAVCVG